MISKILSMNIIVDIGNTFCKVAVVDKNEVVEERVAEVLDEAVLADMVVRYTPSMAAVASTRGDGEAVVSVVARHVDRVLHVTQATQMPIDVEYDTPQTLGVDRVAVAVGVKQLYGCGDALIIDMGSAITFDLLEGGVFRGGNISPGVAMRLRALHEYTASLPLCEASADFSTERLGRSTREAVTEGVMRGVLHEIEGYVTSFLAEKQKIRIIFSGGDAKYFVNRIKNAIFAGRMVMYIGLNTILEYNAAKGNI